MKAKKYVLTGTAAVLLPVIIIAFQNLSANSAVHECPATSYAEILNCIATRPVDEKLKVLVKGNIELKESEVIRIQNKEWITLAGAGGEKGDQPVTISETQARLMDTTHNSRSMIEILDGAKNIRLENLIFVDPPGNDLRTPCRTKSEPVGTIQIGNLLLCSSPLLVGGVQANAEQISLHKISITSQKQFLLQIRKTDGLTIDESNFTGGSVSGVFFQSGFRHFNTIIHHSNFSLAGTAALSVSDAENVTVYSNKFINNHIDPQYTYALEDGTTAIYPGGQLYLGDTSGTTTLPVGPLKGIKILSNELTMSEEYIDRSADVGFPTTAGIEIMNGTNSGLEDVLVQWNKITSMPRSGISLHCPPGALPCFINDDKVRITVRDNILNGNLRGFPQLDERYGINLEKNPHSGPNVFSNSLYIPGAGYVKADLSQSQKECVTDPTTKQCTVLIKATIENMPAGASLVIRVNGALFKNFLSQNSAQAEATWIKKGTYVFSLHLSKDPTDPAIANWHVQGL